MIALQESMFAPELPLAGRIRSGETPDGTLKLLKQTTTDKLGVASPKYLERYEE